MVRRGRRFESVRGLYSLRSTCKSHSSVVIDGITEHLPAASGPLSSSPGGPQSTCKSSCCPVRQSTSVERRDSVVPALRAVPANGPSQPVFIDRLFIVRRSVWRLGIGLGDGTRSEEAGAGSGRRSVARPGPERVGAVTRSFHANSAPFTAGARLLRSPIAPCASGASRRRRPRASRRDHRCRPSLSPRRRSSNRRATTSRWPLCARARSG
jgi:hypothetical protein